MLTKEEVGLMQTKSDIETLLKQKTELQRMIDEMAGQTEDYYKKRQEAAGEYERAKLETAKLFKDAKDEKASLEDLRREIQSKELAVKISTEKLNDLKAEFAGERRIYEARLKDLDTKEKEFFVKKQDLDKREESLLTRLDDLDTRERVFNAEIKGKKEELEQQINSLKSAEISAKKEKDEALKAQEQYLKQKQDNETKTAEALEALEKRKANQDAEAEATRQHLRKRELSIVEKEKDVEQLKSELRTKLEDIALEKGREAAKDKKKK